MDDERRTMNYYGIDDMVVFIVLSLRGGGKMATVKKLVTKTTLSDAQKLANLQSKFMKIYEQQLTAGGYGSFRVALAKCEQVLLELNSSSRGFIAHRIEKMSIAELQTMIDRAGSSQGDGGSVRKLPGLILALLPELEALIGHAGTSQEMANDILNKAIAAFLEQFHKMKDGASEAKQC